MNYYERHLGDYYKHAGHLSMLEHGALNLLLDRYYVTEAGIPADEAYRIARAKTKEEQAAADQVLKEFFWLEGNVWLKKSCEEDLARYRDERQDSVDEREHERDRKRRSRERRKALFAQLREHNIVPKWDTSIAELESLLKQARGDRSRTGHADKDAPVTDQSRGQVPGQDADVPPPGTAIPGTNPQTPVSKKPPTPLQGADRAKARSERKPRDIRAASLDAWDRSTKAIDKIPGTPLTWDDAKRLINDPDAHSSILAVGGYKTVADRTEFTQSELKRRFREHYEQAFENPREGASQNGHESTDAPGIRELQGHMDQAAKGMPQ